MTQRVVDEVRLKPVKSPWALAGGWLSPWGVALSAGASIIVLFSALAFMLREKPLPRSRPDLPVRPQVATQIIAAMTQADEGG